MADGSPAEAVRAAWHQGGIAWVDGPSAEVAFDAAEKAGLLKDVVLKADGSVPASEVRRVAWKAAQRNPWLVEPTERPVSRQSGASGGRVGVNGPGNLLGFTGPSKQHLRSKYNY